MVCLGFSFSGTHSIWWTWTTFWKGRKPRCVKLSSNLIWDMMMTLCGPFWLGARNAVRKSNMCSHNPLVTLYVSDRSRCGTVWILRSLAHPLVTLGLSDCSRSAAVLILRWLAQPSRHFERVRSLSLWPGAHLNVKEILCRDLGKEVIFTELARRSCTKSYYRSCTKSSYRDLVQRSCQQSSYRELVQRSLQDSCQGTSYRDLVQRHCIEVCCRDLAKRSLTQILPRKSKRALLESLYRDSIKRFCKGELHSAEILPRDPLQKPCHESSYRQLLQRSHTEISF